MKIAENYPTVENTVGKGEIARYKQFLVFPQCFQKACFPGALKGVIAWKWVKINILMISVFDSVQDIVGKEENAGYQHSSFPTIFSVAFFFQ